MKKQPRNVKPVSSAIVGKCLVCDAENVRVYPGPIPRHVDDKACDVQRALNALRRKTTHAFGIGPKAIGRVRTRRTA